MCLCNALLSGDCGLGRVYASETKYRINVQRHCSNLPGFITMSLLLKTKKLGLRLIERKQNELAQNLQKRTKQLRHHRSIGENVGIPASFPESKRGQYRPFTPNPMPIQTPVAAIIAQIPSFESRPMERAAIHAITDLGFEIFNSSPLINQLLLFLNVVVWCSDRQAERADTIESYRRYRPPITFRNINT